MSSARYPPHKLGAIFNYIGVQLEVSAELEELGKDDESDLHFSEFLREITNGEYIWALYEVLRALTDAEEQVELSPLQDAILADVVTGIKARFFDQELQSDDKADIEQSKQAIWYLYELAMAHLKESSTSSLPEDDDEQWKGPGDLKNEDWEVVFDLITEGFDWEAEWYLSPHFSLIDPYPHIPNYQEYRLARIWLLSHFEATTANLKKPK